MNVAFSHLFSDILMCRWRPGYGPWVILVSSLWAQFLLSLGSWDTLWDGLERLALRNQFFFFLRQLGIMAIFSQKALESRLLLCWSQREP